MFQRRLGAMEREGQVLRNRKGTYILPERASLTAGKVQGHQDGYGFLLPDDGSADIFIAQHQMAKVLHGDRALVRVTGVDRKGRPEGSIVEVTERANTRVVGRVLVEHGLVFVVPENRRIAQDILVPPEKKSKIKPESGMVVMVDIIAVSYTHLDVYKRQHQCCAVRRGVAGHFLARTDWPTRAIRGNSVVRHPD